MTLQELDSPNALESFQSSNANSLICFSATWCGPCRASRPQLEELARTYDSDPSTDVAVGIAYEHDLSESIQQYGIRAFPTYVLFVECGKREAGRIEGVNFDGIRKMVSDAGCKKDLGEGYSLGGGKGGDDSKRLTAEEARAQRLAKFQPKVKDALDSANAAANADSASASASTSTADQPMQDAPDTTTATANDADDDGVNSNATTATANDGDASASVKDEEMQDAANSNANDNTDNNNDNNDDALMANLSKDDLDQLTGAMGFSLVRAQKGLLNGTGGVEGAIEWIMQHQDDDDIDDPVYCTKASSSASGSSSAIAQSYKCNECGRILSNMANLELHANKTGHSDFEESTHAVKPLTAEEKQKKILEIKNLLKAKRAEREEAEKVDQVEREKQRRFMGKEMAKTREEMERDQRKREAAKRRKEKEDFKRERDRIRKELEKDKRDRAANKGKLSSKLGVDGYNPDGIQYDLDADGDHKDTAPVPQPSPAKRPKASAAKIDQYISKVSSYRAGGDGGKCLKILLLYVKNVVDNPNEDKYRSINMESNAYKAKVKPFMGAKSLLLALGFNLNESADRLVLAEDADRDLLATTKQKLEAAFASY